MGPRVLQITRTSCRKWVLAFPSIHVKLFGSMVVNYVHINWCLNVSCKYSWVEDLRQCLRFWLILVIIMELIHLLCAWEYGTGWNYSNTWESYLAEPVMAGPHFSSPLIMLKLRTICTILCNPPSVPKLSSHKPELAWYIAICQYDRPCHVLYLNHIILTQCIIAIVNLWNVDWEVLGSSPPMPLFYLRALHLDAATFIFFLQLTILCWSVSFKCNQFYLSQ